jgi:hypothetical protein
VVSGAFPGTESVGAERVDTGGDDAVVRAGVEPSGVRVDTVSAGVRTGVTSVAGARLGAVSGVVLVRVVSVGVVA